ncbi:MAG: stage III sporulation AC/AD family protein [Oscillospiraceae bacterium]
MDIIAIAGICIVAVVLCKLLDKYGKEYSIFIGIAVSAIILISIIGLLKPVIATITDIFTQSGVSGEQLKILFKTLGICYITQFAYDVCKDGGENAIASQIEIAGKASVLIISLPLFTSLISIVSKLIYI